METIRKHRKLALLGSSVIVVSLAALFIFSSFVFPAMQTSQQDQTLSTAIGQQFNGALNQAFHPILTIKVTDPNGSLAHEYVNTDDLILNNFINATRAMFTPGGTTTFEMTDTGGTKRVLNNYAAQYTFWDTSSSTYCVSVTFCGMSTELGTGTTPAARTDHAIQTPYMSLMPAGQSGYDPTTGNVTISGSEVASSSATITEAGLIIQGYDGAVSSPATRTYLWFHDEFLGVGVTTGQTVSVQYTIELLNTGFTNSFGCFLSQMFSSALQGYGDTPCSISGIPGYGTNNCGYLVTTAPGCYMDANDNNDPYIMVGVGTTAVARTQTGLATSTCSTQALSSATITSTSTLLLHATNNCANAETITEAGLVMRWFYPNQYSWTMIWRTEFSGVSVGAASSIQITFDLVFN